MPFNLTTIVGTCKTIMNSKDTLKEIRNFPAEERKKYRDVVSETFEIFDQTILIINDRMRDVLTIRDNGEFLNEVEFISDHDRWEQIERELRVCRKLRETGREMKTLFERVGVNVSISDSDRLTEYFNWILDVGEGGMANAISLTLSEFSERARYLYPDQSEEIQKLRDDLYNWKSELRKMRVEWIAFETDLYKII